MTAIAERYARAVESSHLEWSGFDVCDIDIITAAGWASRDSPAGAFFCRLKNQFDVLHAEVKKIDPKAPAADHRLASVGALRYLPEAKAIATDMARGIAERERLNIRPELMAEMAWQGLSVWLDPNCAPCGGTGRTGEWGGPMPECKCCRGSGKRRGNTGRTEDQQFLIDRLAMAISSRVGSFLGRTKERMAEAM